MALNNWSESIVIAEPADEAALADDCRALINRLEKKEYVPDVILNLQRVTHLNSSNISQMLELEKKLEAEECRLRVCCVQDSVWSILLMTGLDGVFEFTDDVSTSIASLQIGL